MKIQKVIRFAFLFSAAAAAACAASGSKPSTLPAVTQRIDPSGVSPHTQTAEPGTLLRFENADVRPHEIYSNDCPELGTTTLAPGQTYVAQLDLGPKLCHFQDLLAPAESEYWGTVRVNGSPITDPAARL